MEYDRLTKFLKFFINRPNHLAKYLIDNNLINKEFLKKISDEDLDLEDGDKKIVSVYFLDITQMNNYLTNLTAESRSPKYNRNIIEELEKELENCISDERYEDAIRIRDYLRNMKIKRKS